MRIALDAEVFEWNPRRGIPRVYREILRRAPTADPAVELLVAGGPGVRWDELAGLPVRMERIPGVRPDARPWRVWSRVAPPLNRLAARRYWDRCRADAFHTTHYGLPPVHGPLFCIVHDMLPELFPESFGAVAARTLAARKRAAVARAARVLCVSANTLRDLVRLTGIPESKCRVVHNAGFADEVLAGQAGVAQAADRPFLLYVGGWRMPYKNFRSVVEALAAPDFDGLRLVVAGPERPERGEVERLGGVGPERRIEFKVGCSDNELIGLYRGCAAFVMPSLYEGFGIPVIEALGCGAPVACAHAGPLPEVGGEAVQYFDPRSVAELRAALRSALAEARTPDAVARRRQQAGRFSWDRAAREFCRAAREIAER